MHADKCFPGEHRHYEFHYSSEKHSFQPRENLVLSIELERSTYTLLFRPELLKNSATFLLPTLAATIILDDSCRISASL